MDDSKKLIKILFYSDVILNNFNNKNNITIPNKNIDIPSNLNNNLFTQFYTNSKLSINNDSIQHIKKLYDINNNNISDIITYLFINNTFEIPQNKITIDFNHITDLTNQLNNLDLNIQNDTTLTVDELKKKLCENINISSEYEELYNPYKNIIGHFVINNAHDIYDKIIHYTSEDYLLLNEPMLKSNVLSFNILSNIILNMLNNNNDLTSYNIKKNIDNKKNIEYNINITLPYYIINYFKPKKIININND